MKPKPMYKEVKASVRLPERIGKNIISKSYHCIEKNGRPRICYYDFDEGHWYDVFNELKYVVDFWLEKKPQQNAEEFVKNINLADLLDYENSDHIGVPIDRKALIELLENYAQSVGVSEEFREKDWAVYNWLDDEGSDNWKIGRIVKTNDGLMYFNDDGTERSGYMPITTGVKKVASGLSTQPQPKEEEKCKHDRREKVRDLKGWYCLDCGYDYITYERG
jgi:hypothetical protein